MIRNLSEEKELVENGEKGSTRFFLSFGMSILFLGLVAGAIRFWATNGTVLLPAFRYYFFLSIPFFLVGLIRRELSSWSVLVQPGSFIVILVIYFFTDMLCRDYNLLQGPSIRGLILLFAFISYLMICKRSLIFLNLCAAAVPFLFLYGFLSYTNGQLIYSDDHPSMFFRLQMLKENFPFIPFYNPTWNAGFDNRDFFATGVLNVFFIFAPIIYLVDLIKSYNIIIGLLVFCFVPLATYIAAKVEELEHPLPAIAALLSLSSSLLWYRWCLKYGAIGFVTSMSLLPLNIVLSAKILSSSRELSSLEAVLYVLSISLMFFWSLSGLMFIPVIFLFTLFAKRIFAKRYVKGIIVAVLAINLPWMILFISASSVPKFLQMDKVGVLNREQGLKTASVSVEQDSHEIKSKTVRGGLKKTTPKNILKALREFSVKVNPLILFLGLPGYFLLRRSSTRILYILVGIWLFLLGTFGASFKPQLELDRALVVLGLFSSVPVSHVFGWALRKNKLLASSVLCGFLFAGLFSVSGVIYNRSSEQYAVSNNLLWRLSNAIKEEGGSGRTIFSGFILHDLNMGHVAPLTIFSGKPLIASTPFHSVWWYTDIIPNSYRKRGSEGIEEFFDLKNATSVVSREKKWKNYFERYPDKYKLVFSENGFRLYRRRSQGSYFFEGAGEILEQRSNGIKLRVDSESVVLKFNFLPFLRSDNCRILPEVVRGTESSQDLTVREEEIRLIRLESCVPGSIVNISAKSPFGRLFNFSR
ncbi:MAG: hypothetical protein GYA55_02180 [SAR324 cluster bacterium]|uniref:Glycosyltransferase RgtA/B/C/D-like domain-containing protein n=1 Tax=SAR324 cluster bacterium TaxID=2024889 RepID=A0A7X9FPK9_9DELT|nr:hypothetical protein [SAR324 cluster bacterium]